MVYYVIYILTVYLYIIRYLDLVHIFIPKCRSIEHAETREALIYSNFVRFFFFSSSAFFESDAVA